MLLHVGDARHDSVGVANGGAVAVVCLCLQHGIPRVTEAHLAVGKKVAAFKGYTVAMQAQCADVGAQYIRELTAVRANFMSKQLMAVGDPSLCESAPAAAPALAAPTLSRQASASGDTEPETWQPAAPAPANSDLEETLEEEEEWDTGEGWEIPE